MRPERRARLAAALIGLATMAVLVGGWKLYVEWFDVSRFVLPPPERVASATVELLGEARTWAHTWTTLQEILAGFAIATAAGIVIGVVLAESPLLDRAFTPYLVALQVLPKVAVIPLLLLWMGFGMSSKIVVAAIFGFFPVLAGTKAGVRSVESGHRDLLATLRAGHRHRLLLLELPSALPSILTGMEVSIVLATIGAVVAEYLAGGEGLGWLAVVSLNQLQVDSLFAVIVLLSFVGFVLHAAVAGLRRLLVPWHPSSGRPVPGL